MSLLKHIPSSTTKKNENEKGRERRNKKGRERMTGKLGLMGYWILNHMNEKLTIRYKKKTKRTYETYVLIINMI